MSLLDPPVFDRRAVCISDDPQLAATISSLYVREAEYFTVLIGPRMDRHDADAEVARRCNAVAKVRPELVILANLDSRAESRIRELLKDQRIISVSSAQEAVRLLGQSASDAGELRCRTGEVGPALLEARKRGLMLYVDHMADPIAFPAQPTSEDHLVAIDDHDGMAQVIGANYAHSIGADLALIPQREESLRQTVYREIDSRVAHRGTARGDRALTSLRALGRELEPSLQIGAHKFATFITRGIPYGFFRPATPSTHLLSYPQLGEMIVSGIYWAAIRPHSYAAVLVDPGDFQPSETPVVAAALARMGLVVEAVTGPSATAEVVALFLQAYPHDLFFVCSHCGEVPGSHLTIRVPDADGRSRVVEFDEVLQFYPLMFADKPGDQFDVSHLLVPTAIDGKDWHDARPEEGRHYTSIWNFLHETARKDWPIVREEVVSHVAHTTAIQLKQGYLLLGAVQVIDVGVSPVVFNNSCLSYYDAAMSLTFAGARAYVGTLAPVDTSHAQRLAEIIFQEGVKEASLPLALWLAQQRVFHDSYDRTYVHVGCHFTCIRPPSHPAGSVLRSRLLDAKARWQRPRQPREHSNLERVGQFLRFICGLLKRWDG